MKQYVSWAISLLNYKEPQQAQQKAIRRWWDFISHRLAASPFLVVGASKAASLADVVTLYAARKLGVTFDNAEKWTSAVMRHIEQTAPSSCSQQKVSAPTLVLIIGGDILYHARAVIFAAVSSTITVLRAGHGC